MDQKITDVISDPEITKKEKSGQTETTQGLKDIRVAELTASIPT